MINLKLIHGPQVISQNSITLQNILNQPIHPAYSLCQRAVENVGLSLTSEDQAFLLAVIDRFIYQKSGTTIPPTPSWAESLLQELNQTKESTAITISNGTSNSSTSNTSLANRSQTKPRISSAALTKYKQYLKSNADQTFVLEIGPGAKDDAQDVLRVFSTDEILRKSITKIVIDCFKEQHGNSKSYYILKPSIFRLINSFENLTDIELKNSEKPWDLKRDGMGIGDLGNNQNLISITLENFGQFNDLNGLQNISTLKELTVNKCYGVSDISFLTGMKLERLTLIEINAQSNFLWLTQCETLQELTLIREVCSRSKDRDELLSKSCSELVEALQKSNHSLTRLHLERWPIDNINFLSESSSIIELVCNSCRHLEHIYALRGNHSIKKVILNNCDLVSLRGLEESDSLIHLDISGCKKLIGVDALAENSSLLTLNASHCEQLQNLDGLKQNRTLQELDISNCPKISTLEPLCNNPSLQIVKANYCEGLVTLNGLTECSSLHTVEFSNCKNLQDISALTSHSYLQMVDLSFCKKLVDFSILADCSELVGIKLDGLNFTDEELLAFQDKAGLYISIAHTDTTHFVFINNEWKMAGLNIGATPNIEMGLIKTQYPNIEIQEVRRSLYP